MTVSESLQNSSTPCSCVGPCAGYGTKSGCPSLLVMVTLIAAKDALAASLHGGAGVVA
jgi:hypothetical protein